MPITIVETPGASNANSFVSAAEMTSYCEARLNASVWTGAAAQLPALVEATRDLSLLDYTGFRVTETQALSWPRQYAPKVDATLDTGVPDYALTEIPQRIKDATCELALAYLKAGTADLAAEPDSQNIIREKVDVLETEYADPMTRSRGLGRFPRVMDLVRPLISTAQAFGRVVRQ